MDVYDFDGTIYRGDSSIDFWRHCVKRCPLVLIEMIPAFWGLCMYIFGICTKTECKAKFFGFLRRISDTDEAVRSFWEKHESRLASWYVAQKTDNPVIISASPEFLLAPLCDNLGATLIASKVNPRNGAFLYENCHGPEKLVRFKEMYPDASINAFYSDSLSDGPMARMAHRAYMIKNGKPIPWDSYRPSALSKFKSTFFTREFILFLFCGGCGTLVNFLCSLLISSFINPTIAYACGYAVSLFATYSLNTALIFKLPFSLKRFAKFTVSYMPNFIILFTFVAVLMNIFFWPKVLVYALAAVFGLPLTFVLVKIFAFSKRRGEK